MRSCQLVLISHMPKHPVSEHLHHVLPPCGYKVCWVYCQKSAHISQQLALQLVARALVTSGQQDDARQRHVPPVRLSVPSKKGRGRRTVRGLFVQEQSGLESVKRGRQTDSVR